ncbi:peptide methionine sulfoxide reductase MsrA [Pseudomonas chlororaphis subsp. aurantiaca]|uniref:hypothetical protein n=1 Tax=Pseudomonas TaxID=286 RepID=UPI0005BED018|nr:MULTISPECIES: hypothetical protein [Pseudomonas]AJO77507.1 hypothetical protein TO66_09415 [Pseudomonas sp. MRSN 12121]BAV74138.1 peptide methionine sulfoxide reductase MsrA [Pseudomonas chlororaphis subsp. aurantiaca]
MAKIIFTLEDSRADNGAPTVTLDMSGVPTGTAHRSAACFISDMLWGMASCEQILGELPAHRRQPSNATLH